MSFAACSISRSLLNRSMLLPMLSNFQNVACHEDLLSFIPVADSQLCAFTNDSGNTEVYHLRDGAWSLLPEDDFVCRTAAWAYERMSIQEAALHNPLFFIEQIANFAANLAARHLLGQPLKTLNQFQCCGEADMIAAVETGISDTLIILRSPRHLVVPELQRLHLLPANPQLAFIQQLMVELNAFPSARQILMGAFVSGPDLSFSARLSRLIAQNPRIASSISWLDRTTLSMVRDEQLQSDDSPTHHMHDALKGYSVGLGLLTIVDIRTVNTLEVQVCHERLIEDELHRRLIGAEGVGVATHASSDHGPVISIAMPSFQRLEIISVNGKRPTDTWLLALITRHNLQLNALSEISLGLSRKKPHEVLT
jgi:hypothetical protein